MIKKAQWYRLKPKSLSCPIANRENITLCVKELKESQITYDASKVKWKDLLFWKIFN
jgi:hypothetical protein